MFLVNKYKSWYDSIIINAQSQERKKVRRDNLLYVYYEKHHIIPQCMGGTETVLLSAKEHFICHLLLCKFTTGTIRHKMINALIKMQFAKSDGQERYSSKSYAIVRTLIAEKNSEMFKGKPKSAETRKRISEGRKGIKFSETHLANMSKVRKGVNTGSDNPFHGRKHSAETKTHWSAIRKGKTTRGSTGMKWYNNGVERGMFFPDQVPESWLPGKQLNPRF